MSKVCCKKKGFKPAKFNACRIGWTKIKLTRCKLKKISKKRKQWGTPIKKIKVTKRKLPKVPRKTWNKSKQLRKIRKIRKLPKIQQRKRKIH